MPLTPWWFRKSSESTIGEPTMTNSGRLWAIGYDDMERAHQVRDEIARLGWEGHYFTLEDLAVVVRQSDRSFTLERRTVPSRIEHPGLHRRGSPRGPGARRAADRCGGWRRGWGCRHRKLGRGRD